MDGARGWNAFSGELPPGLCGSSRARVPGKWVPAGLMGSGLLGLGAGTLRPPENGFPVGVRDLGLVDGVSGALDEGVRGTLLAIEAC